MRTSAFILLFLLSAKSLAGLYFESTEGQMSLTLAQPFVGVELGIYDLENEERTLKLLGEGDTVVSFARRIILDVGFVYTSAYGETLMYSDETIGIYIRKGDGTGTLYYDRNPEAFQAFTIEGAQEFTPEVNLVSLPSTLFMFMSGIVTMGAMRI